MSPAPNSIGPKELAPTLNLNAPQARRSRLLVVDDQPINIQVLYQTFASDHQVLMATSAEQALELCASKQPDLVLLDVVMPGMDGYEVCRRLKLDEATRDIPVIFVTAQNDESAETRGLDAGAVDFISKPINPNIVRARVRTHLTLKAQADLLREWVYTDGLTGVHNRRCFDERLAVEWSRAVRSGSALSVVLLDVDFFKRYNDCYGHLAGDECLRRLATALKACVRRPSDLVARYGGEEFVCLLPDTDLAGAMTVAEELGQLLFVQQIAHAESPVAKVVTVSLGVCCKPASSAAGAGAGAGAGSGGSAEALMREADAQLYVAKARGRHQASGAVMHEA